MFRVIVVDDEPAALVHICSIIEQKCPEFEVVATAENGVEGMEKIKLLQPDVVISDVSMPLMNGIEMVAQIKQEFPNIYSVIVSGHQEFDYARAALQWGVCDYILKPLTPARVQETLQRLQKKLEDEHYHMRNEIIHKLCNGVECDDSQIAKFFSYESYYGAIIRKNGLPRRFSGAGNMEVYSEANEIVTIYGRDEMESLYIIPRELISEMGFRSYICNVQKKEKQKDQYSTLVFAGKSFPVTQLRNIVQGLYRELDTVSTVGYTQAIELKDKPGTKEIIFNHEEINQVLKNFEYMLKEQKIEKLKKELQRFYQIWKEEHKPQLWLEYVSKQILYIMRKYSKDSITLIECEYMMEDAFFYATSADMLIETLFEIMFYYIKGVKGTAKVDSLEFFGDIQEYLAEHLSENITLQMVCRRFGISQTYLSKMFRKYTGDSFNRYITEIRLKKAITLMRANPDFYIKDVAAIVGYPDQFYFSRIFRSYTGKCPSDYLGEL